MARTAYPVASSTTRQRNNAARPFVDRIHLPTTPQTTPAFNVGREVGVQLREYIWVPGKIINADYHARYASVVYAIKYVAADGCERTEGFFPKDVRDQA